MTQPANDSPRRTAAGASPRVSSLCQAGFHQGFPASGGGCHGPGGHEVAGHWIQFNECGCGCHDGGSK